MDVTGRIDGEITSAVSPSPVARLNLDTFLAHSITLTLATGIVNTANWLYHVVMSRSLGPEAYGVLSAIIGVLIVFSIPFNAIQMGVSAFVARSDAYNRPDLRAFFLFGVAACLALLAGSRWLAHLMQLDATAPIIVAAVALIPWSVLPVLRGVLQGRQRAIALGLSMAAESTLKLAAGALLVALGYGVSGAVGGVAAGAVIACGATLMALRPPAEWRGDDMVAPLGPLLRSLAPYAAAIGCFTLLTQADVVIVKALFPARQAGLYAAASTGAKIVLYLTGALPMVMLPRLMRPSTGQKDGRAVLARTMLYGGLAGGALVAAYFIVPRPLIGLLFGSAYEDAAPLLGPLGVAMLAYELALLGVYYLLSVQRLSALLPALPLVVIFPVAVWIFRADLQTVVTVMASLGVLSLALVTWSTTREVADAAAG